MRLIQQKRPRIKLEMVKSKTAITSYAGLALVRDSLKEFGLIDEMKKFLLKKAGYADEVILEAIVLLIASGGRSLSDWEYLSGELGFQKLFGQCPSVDTLERYLRRLDMEEVEYEGKQGQIGYSKLLERLHKRMIELSYKLAGKPKELSLDLDASLFASDKREALYCYEKIKAYQPFLAYCPELRMVLSHEFRDGNVNASLGYERMSKQCIELFPEVKWRIRADSAGYQLKWLDWMESQGITYYVTVDGFEGLKELLQREKSWSSYLDAHGIRSQQELSEIAYCPSFSSQGELRLRARAMRFIGIRKPKASQGRLWGEEYSYQVLVTNSPERDLNKILQSHRGRCGSVEYAFSQLKSGCGLSRLPSGEFEVNAAWFSLGILTHNLLRLLQEHLLPEKMKRCEIQTLRFRFLRAAAWVKQQGRQIVLRVSQGHRFYQQLLEAREKLRKSCQILHAAFT